MDKAPDTGLYIGQAAAILGISAEAVRKRLKRGSLQGSKDSAGRWRVTLDTAPTGGQDASRTAQEELIRQLRDEVAFLRTELAARSDEVRRAHVLVQQAQTALPAPPSGLAAMVKRMFGR